MIGILCIIDLNYIPYLKKYTDYFDENNIDYEVVYWERMDNKKKYDFRTVEFHYNSDLKLSRKRKVVGMIKYRKFVVNVLNEKKYDKLIVLSTLMGVIIFDVLIKKYSGKFIFDIRDYTYENLSIYRFIEGTIIKNSFKTVISSDGFREFLPKLDKYILCHNFLKSEINRKHRFEKKMSGPIELTFIGAVRHFALDKIVVDTFGKDARFNVVFHGYGASYDDLYKYVLGKNVRLTGLYDRKDKEKLLKSADIINSYYDEQEVVNRYALSNKLYDAAIYRKPLWANPDTYMGKLACKKGIAINCKIDPDNIYRAYKSIDPDKFEESCRSFIRDIIEDDQKFFKMLRDFYLNL